MAGRRALRLPAAPGRAAARPDPDHRAPGPRAAPPVPVPGPLRGGHAARAARPGPPGQPLRLRLTRTFTMTKQIHLAAHFPGVNNTTVWSDPAAGSHIEFDSFRQFAQTAER